MWMWCPVCNCYNGLDYVCVCLSVKKHIYIAPCVWYVAAYQSTLEPLCVLSYLPVIVRFHSLTGRLLLEVRRMQATAPESFYTSLRSDLSLDFVSMMKFTQALAGLDESTQWHGQLSTNHCMIRSLVVGENTDKKGFAGVYLLLWLLECLPLTQWCKMSERSVIFTQTAKSLHSTSLRFRFFHAKCTCNFFPLMTFGSRFSIVTLCQTVMAVVSEIFSELIDAMMHFVPRFYTLVSCSSCSSLSVKQSKSTRLTSYKVFWPFTNKCCDRM